MTTGTLHAGSSNDEVVFADARLMRAQSARLYGSKRSNSLFTTP